MTAEDFRRLEPLLELATDWFWEMDADLRFTYFSPGAFDNLSIDAKSMLGQKRTKLFTPEDLKAPDVQEHIHCLETRAPFRNFVYRAVLPSGSTRFFSVSGLPIFDENKQFQGYQGATTDVTDTILAKREAEDARARLQTQTELLESTLNGLNQAVIAFDPELKLLVCNRPLINIFKFPEKLARPGISLEDIIQHNIKQGWLHHINGESDTVVRKRLHLFRSDEDGVETLTHPDGTILQLSRRFLDTGVLILTYTDVTEQKRQEKQLLEAKEAAEFANYTKTQFLSNMSHELRTPLNAIIGFSEIIRDELYGPLGKPEYIDFAKDIHASGSHLLSIISDILDLSRLEAGQKELSETEVDVNATVVSCLHYVQRRAQKNDLLLENRIPERLPPLIADEVILRQILINLLSNAVKFTEQGQVTITAAQRPDKGLRVTVADTGIGMSDDEVEIALAPFAQIESHLTRKYEGTGLGLPLVRNLVSLHKATLTVESKKGEGTSVHIDFPPERTLPPRAEKPKAKYEDATKNQA